jgi:hypothetical protein
MQSARAKFASGQIRLGSRFCSGCSTCAASLGASARLDGWTPGRGRPLSRCVHTSHGLVDVRRLPDSGGLQKLRTHAFWCCWGETAWEVVGRWRYITINNESSSD